MKNYHLIIMVLLSQLVISQEAYSEYNSSYFKKKYNISVADSKNDNEITFYIDCASLDKTSKEAILMVKGSEIDKFTAYLLKIKELRSKWQQTAIDNNVKDLTKEVELEKPTFSSGFRYGKWNFDFSTSLGARFKIINGEYLMILTSGELQSSSNQFIKSDGFTIVFSSDLEFDDFITKLNVEKATSMINAKKAKENLFKE